MIAARPYERLMCTAYDPEILEGMPSFGITMICNLSDIDIPPGVTPHPEIEALKLCVGILDEKNKFGWTGLSGPLRSSVIRLLMEQELVNQWALVYLGPKDTVAKLSKQKGEGQ